MTEKIDAQSQQEHATSQKDREFSARGGAGFYFGVYDEMNAAEDSENQQSQRRWYHKISNWVRRALGFLNEYSTLIIMLATLVNLLVAYLQWSTMIEETAANQKSAKAAEDQLAEMRSGSADTKIVAEAAKDSATAAGKAVDVAQENVAVAKATLDASIERDRRDQRAWVGLNNVQVLNKLTAGEPLKTRAVLANSGKSPAIGVFVNGYMDFLMKMEGDQRNPFTKDERYAPCIQPKPTWSDTLGGTMMLPGPNTGSLDRLSPVVPGVFIKIATRDPVKKIGFQDLTDVERSEIGAMRTVPDVSPSAVLEVGLYFVGCVDYFDIFRIAHRTTFCLKYLHNGPFEPEMPKGAFTPCEYGNAGD